MFRTIWNKLVSATSRTTTEPQAYGESRYVVNGTNGDGAKWPGGISGAGLGVAINHRTTRQSARTAMHDSMQARAIVERMSDTVGDGGLRLELAPRWELLGISEEEATRWAREVEARFDLWAKDKKQHRAANLTWYQTHNLYQLFQHRDNDIFVRFYYDTDPELQNPLQFDFIDPDQVRGDAFTTSYSIPGQSDGIERDARGRETGYKVWLRKPDGGLESVTVPARLPSGRLQMIHGYRPEYAGQGRGYSRLAHAIQEFQNITDFSASTIKKAINQAQFVAFVEPAKDEDTPHNPLEQMINSAAGPVPSQVFGSNPTAAPADATPAPLGGLDSYRFVPEVATGTPGGLFLANLTKGSTIKFPGATSPADSFDKFVDAFGYILAASIGIPLEIVLMRFSNNYSASRATLLLFWRICLNWRAEMAADYLDPTFESWLACEIGAGRASAPGWSDPRLRAAWLNKNWIGAPPPDIDPSKSAKARRDNIAIGVTNLDLEARNFNGTSAANNLAKNRELYEDFPVAPWEPNSVTPEEPSKPLGDDDDD